MAGTTRFAAWAYESDEPLRADLERRGYTLAEWTRAMGMVLEDIRLPRPEIELGPTDWFEYLRLLGVPPGFLPWCRPRRLSRPGRTRRRGERRNGDGIRSRQRLRHL